MTEQEWLECADPGPMLEFLRSKVSERKLRLFAVACCRSIWSMLPDERSRKAVEVAERLADGQTSEEERASSADRAEDKACENAGDDLDTPAWAAYWSAAPYAHQSAEMSAYQASAERSDRPEVLRQVQFLRDIFGNPFRLVTAEPSWLTPTVVSLAIAIYDERAFDRLPILADALEDAGCTNADLLNHCRQPGEHVLGCWVVDLVLEKQ